MNDISNNFKWNINDYLIIKNTLKFAGTPDAIKYFSQTCKKLTNYGYWFLLSNLWVSYSGYSDLSLWKKLFLSNREGRKKSIMKPSEVKVYDQLPWFITAYRAHRKNESDWISYTLNKETAFRFAKERNVNSIKEYEIKRRDIMALFLRRNEDELIVLDKDKAEFVREHICVGNSATISLWGNDPGYICLPLKQNIPQPQDKSWRLIKCPICGRECWESMPARKLLKGSSVKAACTLCSLKQGIIRK